MTPTINLPARPRRREVWMMPTADGEKPHLIISNSRMNEAVSYPFIHVIWMGTNLTRVRFAEHVVLGAGDHPVVGFVDCSTLRRASKGHLVRRFGALTPGTMARVEEGIRVALGFER
jgi:mRNA-degrading endonuclease toxin of MazEF toxin-antitoxin module